MGQFNVGDLVVFKDEEYLKIRMLGKGPFEVTGVQVDTVLICGDNPQYNRNIPIFPKRLQHYISTIIPLEEML